MREHSTKCPVPGCDQAKDPNRKYCPAHKRYPRMLRNQQYREEGRCSQAGCTKWPEPGYRTCPHHLAEGRKKHEKYPRDCSPKWDGKTCAHHSCKNPSSPGNRLCADHLKYQAEYKKRRPELFRDRTLAYNARTRIAAIAAYGGECAMCGEDDAIVLQIDHINGRTPECKKGVAEMRRLKILGFPRGDIQLLCANCHVRKTYDQLGFRVALHDGV